MPGDSTRPPASSTWLWLSAAGMVVFAGALVALHALDPRFSPSQDTISEYVHGRDGALMIAAFASWSVSLVALACLTAATRVPSDVDALATAQVAALFVAAASIALVACFPTDRGREIPGSIAHHTFPGHVHDVASALATIGIFAAALIGAVRWPGPSRILTVALLSAGIGSSTLLLAVGDPAPGIRQRLLVGVACLWQIVWLLELRRQRLGGRRLTWARSSAGSQCSTS